MSSTRSKSRVAASMSRVPRVRAANAGRSLSSAIPVARLIFPICASSALIWSFVAPVTLRIAVDMRTNDFWSSAAAFAANPIPAASVPTPAAAASPNFFSDAPNSERDWSASRRLFLSGPALPTMETVIGFDMV